MTQTLYAHMNKTKENDDIDKPLTNLIQTVKNIRPNQGYYLRKGDKHKSKYISRHSIITIMCDKLCDYISQNSEEM
jgi:hypothetical protein